MNPRVANLTRADHLQASAGLRPDACARGDNALLAQVNVTDEENPLANKALEGLHERNDSVPAARPNLGATE